MSGLRWMAVVCVAAGVPLTVAEKAVSATVPTVSAAALMAKVAENQDRAELERGHYVYVQHARVISRRGKTVMCEEVTDSRVTPTATGSQAELLKLDGRMLAKGKYLTYTALLQKKDDGMSMVENGHDSISISLGNENNDRDLVEHMRSNLTQDGESKDGVDTRLFPLTTKAQKDFAFALAGREKMNGRDVFHVTFRPTEKNEFGWKGDAYIDAEAYEPVVVRTDLARKVPFAVRTLLGTNVPGLGFTIVYAPQPDGVWFPVSLGTEFKLHLLFFFSREILIEARNGSFEKTHVGAKIVEAGDQ